MKKNIYFLAAFAFFLFSCGNGDSEGNGGDAKGEVNWNNAADSTANSLISNFWNAGVKYFNYDSNGNLTFHYWPQAHALDVLIDAYNRTKDSKYLMYFNQWYDGVKAKNGGSFWNEYYDDMEWNALAMLRCYQATNDAKFKEAALQIWDWIKEGWNDNAGGGITWKRGMEYNKNACSNGPACILAARLFREFGDESNKEWALKIYSWEKETLFESSTGKVYDNINSNTGEIQDWIFTYNEGTFIGSAVELYKIMGEKVYLNDAVKAADYTISVLVDNSILKDEGNGDGGLFKGIFVRYFVDLIQQDRLDAVNRKRYLQFINANAETLWLTGTNKQHVYFGTNWRNAPASATGLTEQLSGSMLIEGTALLANKDMI
ncbi:MAG: glycoside hydrolase family 76 protein [Bacteroidales bacterium]|nr:glycoside hydrolase family 76 protein [Bacteroidales bacterium]MDY6001206.1 glycoside hydrolase family 76 protein [Candidatus Cryptobacteroides sp.]